MEKKVLVTGGGGFIGSHLAETLLDLGANVSITIRNKNSNHKFISQILNKVKVFYGDLRELDNCLNSTANHEVVFNLAAKVGGLEYNINHPGSIFKDNLLVFINILEASRINKVDQFITVSSACVYPRYCTIPTPEEEGFKDEPEPTNQGYGWAKRMEELLSKWYKAEFGMNIAIGRPYNAYGPRDNFNPESSHVIPALIKKVLEANNSIEVWGSGEQSRSFIYVEDFIKGLIRLAEIMPKETINIGADEEIQIKDLVFLIRELSNRDIEIKFDTSKPIGQPRRKCNTTRAKKILNFKTQIPLREGLKKTIDWYIKNF
ncbi:MAG: NAD-dependent epimerase/dehydratase family protein [Promethearchaeota archaeon]